MARISANISTDDEMKFAKKIAASKKYIDLDYSVMKDEIVFDGDQELLDKLKKELTSNKKIRITISESTMTGNVAMPDAPMALKKKGTPSGKMPCGTPYFECDDEAFWNLHQKVRGNRQWFDKHYKDTDIAQWARENKGSKFYLKNSNMFRRVKAS